MRNNYPGNCYRCNDKVEAREGHFELIPKKQRVGKKWRLQHASCSIQFRNTKIGREFEKINS